MSYTSGIKNFNFTPAVQVLEFYEQEACPVSKPLQIRAEEN